MENKKGISKLISYWLRHHPEGANLSVDEFGWVLTADLLSALSAKNILLTKENLIAISNDFDKVRWELSDDKIRATHGHSFPVILEDKMSTPPLFLYHGTSLENARLIAGEGILSMKRQFVHLSEEYKQAKLIGQRHGKPFVFKINTEKLLADGWKFYKTSENIWLTTMIPVQYLENIDNQGFVDL